MKPKSYLLSLVTVLALSSVSIHAATIAEFTFATNLTPTTQSTNTSTTSIADTGFTYQFGTADRSANYGGSYFTRGAAVAANTSYSQFTVTPDNDYSIDLTSFSFDFRVQSDLTTDWTTFQLQYSLNGGSSFTVAAAPAVTGQYGSAVEVPSRTGTGGTIDSTAVYDLTGVTVGATNGVIFRIYANANELDGLNIIQRYDNINVAGNVAAIPEPSAALLGGLGMLALLRRRR